MIKVTNLYKTFGPQVVLNDISFLLGRGQKVALIGYNGTGKSILLKIIAGIEKFDSGKVEINAEACVGYLPQDTSLVSDESIINYLKNESGISFLEKKLEKLTSELKDPKKAKLYGELHSKYEHLEGYSFLHKIKIMLTGFGLDNISVNHSLADLSSGQKSKIILVGILLRGVDILLLDEPTNNLDIPALIWLEKFLKKSNASCIIVSHDIQFLDSIVKKIFEIDWNTHALDITGGTYSDYLKMKEKNKLKQKEKYRFQQEEIDRLNESIRDKKAKSEKGASWSGSDNDKFRRGFKRDQSAKSAKIANAMEKRIQQMDIIEKPVERKSFEILINPSQLTGNLEINVLNLITGYGNSFKIGQISFNLRYGNRVGIMGLNGSGKSTLLKTIMGEIMPISGEVKIGSGIVIGNMMQEHENLPRDKSLLNFLLTSANINKQGAYLNLARFGFSKTQSSLLISHLSPGSRARLILCLFSIKSVNCLMLDEPTNHLDIEALKAIEETLQNYKGTILVVSHDRAFLKNISLDFTYVLHNGILTRISDYNVYIKEAEDKARKLINLL